MVISEAQQTASPDSLYMNGPCRITIRPAQLSDANSLTVVHVRSWLAATNRVSDVEEFDSLLRRNTHRWVARLRAASRSSLQTALVAEEKNRVVGLLFAAPSADPDTSADVVQLSALYVLPERWRRGIGRGLQETMFATRQFVERYSRVTLWVAADDGAARAFYKITGWHVDAEGLYRSERSPSGRFVRYYQHTHQHLSGSC
ncbi:MAG: GNAT family N-acetyltransferase [Pseudonocardiaceae bacterium]